MTPPIQHHDLVVATLASGSRGNCTYIGTEREGVLIDCGVSTRQILARLDAVGLGDARIRGVLVTHEHTDHVGAARVLDKALVKRGGYHVPFYMTLGTRHGLHRGCVPTTIRPITSGEVFQIGELLKVEAWTVPHDTPDPVAYAVAVGGARAGVITDLGRSTRLVERQLSSLDVAIVEFNHDVEMLTDGAYPWSLKQRIRSSHGHLSNEDAAQLVRRGASARLRHLVLGHLSAENNTPQLAYEAAERALHAAGRADVTLHVGDQTTPTGPLRAPARPAPEPRRTRVTPTAPREQLSLFA